MPAVVVLSFRHALPLLRWSSTHLFEEDQRSAELSNSGTRHIVGDRAQQKLFHARCGTTQPACAHLQQRRFAAQAPGSPAPKPEKGSELRPGIPVWRMCVPADRDRVRTALLASANATESC